MYKSRRKDGLGGIAKLYHNSTEEFIHEMQNFMDVLFYACKTITEDGIGASDYKLNKSLFFILNLSPLLDVQKSDYDAILQKGITTASVRALKETLTGDLAKLLSVIRTVPIAYDSPEADLAKLHFSGAFGKGVPNPNTYDVECSYAVKLFDIEVYKTIRSAFTVEELEKIESNEGKYAVLAILTGYYISAYYDVVANILRRAGLHYMLLIRTHSTVQDKLDWVFQRLTGEQYNMYLEVDGSIPPSKAERMNLLTTKYCDKSIRDDVVKLLDEIRKDLKIGTKACSKRDFCNIVFVFTGYMTKGWKESRYAPNRRLLALYYGIPEPTYKISECRKFERTEDGKNLIRKIQAFCAKH